MSTQKELLADMLAVLAGRDSDGIKAVLATLVDEHGARLVAESLVEVFHDMSGDSAKAARTDEQLRWQRIAIKLGATVHWSKLNWPS